ncbi:MAG: rhodanese-like domain-containing protein [Mycobacteriales bacterium]
MSALQSLRRLLAGGGAAKMTAVEAQQAQQSGALLLDVRTPQEFRSGHAPRSRNIPLDQLPGRLRELPTGRQVLVICQSGGRSARAAALLGQHGVTVSNVRGGMLAWQRAGLPVEGKRR